MSYKPLAGRFIFVDLSANPQSENGDQMVAIFCERLFWDGSGTDLRVVDGWAKRDSGRVFEALPETPCGRQPPVRSIAAVDYAMEVT